MYGTTASCRLAHAIELYYRQPRAARGLHLAEYRLQGDSPVRLLPEAVEADLMAARSVRLAVGAGAGLQIVPEDVHPLRRVCENEAGAGSSFCTLHSAGRGALRGPRVQRLRHSQTASSSSSKALSRTSPSGSLTFVNCTFQYLR